MATAREVQKYQSQFIGKVVNEVQIYGNMFVIHFTDTSCIEIQTDDEPMEYEITEE